MGHDSAMAFDGDALRGHLEFLVLSSLNGSAAHGYEIAARLKEQSDGRFDIREGSLYPALHRMERSSLVKSKWAKGERGPRRRVYTLTARGRRELEGQRVEWRDLVTAMDAVLQ